MARKTMAFYRYRNRDSADELLETLAAARGAQLDRCATDQGPLGQTGMREWKPLPWHAVLKCDPATTLPDTAALAERWVFEVHEHVAWDRLTPTAATVKFTSLVAPRPDIDDVYFRARYAGHRAVASEHHGACVKYVQNVLITPTFGPTGQLVHAVSELSFDSAASMVAGIYTNGQASIDAVRADTSAFIDFTRACSVLSGGNPKRS